MKLKQIGGKKSVKLLFLLFASLLIGTVSAVTYSYLYMSGTFVVGTQQLEWIKNGAVVPGSTVAMTFSGVQQAIPQWFNQSLYLKNIDASSHNITISVTSALPTADFTYANMYTYDNSTGSLLHIFSLTATNEFMFTTALSSQHAYLMDFGVNATTSASGSYTFSIQVVYE